MTWTIDIERIAGILEGTATIEPGLNAVRASNWQGKSSFIEALKTGLGTSTELTEGRDEGRVHLETPDREVTVRLNREDGTVRRSGTPLLNDEYDVVRAELFACLDDRNPIRRAVRNGENLEDVLMRPLDLQNIDARIADLKRQRESVDDELSQARAAKKRLPGVQEKVTRLEDEIEELRAKRDSIQSADPDGDGTDSTRRELSQARSEQNEAESRIERLEQSIERTEARLSDRREELDSLEIEDGGDIESDLADARDRLAETKRDLEVLQSVYSATELVLDEERLDLVTDVQRELTGDDVVCWVCGNDATREDIEEQLDELGAKNRELRAQTETYRDRVDELEARREEIKQAERRKRDLETEIADLEETLAERRQSLDEARDRLDAASARVEELSESVDETMDELSDVESEIKFREAELNDTTDELEQLESRAERVTELQDEHDAITEEIKSLRNRKDRIKREAREAFDDAMQEIVSRFDTGFETARLTGDFEIVVARDGREASLDSLSEGELELIGFVAALAGRQSFDVAETVPLLLVDSIGGLDDGNLHTLIDYLRERTEYLVFTAYPEYTDFDGTSIDPTEWTIAHDDRVTAD
ncbi:archaea-specific SMC-related protein [Halosimplex sp. J119]